MSSTHGTVQKVRCPRELRFVDYEFASDEHGSSSFWMYVTSVTPAKSVCMLTSAHTYLAALLVARTIAARDPGCVYIDTASNMHSPAAPLSSVL